MEAKESDFYKDCGDGTGKVLKEDVYYCPGCGQTIKLPCIRNYQVPNHTHARGGGYTVYQFVYVGRF